jgi:hypothetical protein
MQESLQITELKIEQILSSSLIEISISVFRQWMTKGDIIKIALFY